MSRTVVAWKPRSANSALAASSTRWRVSALLAATAMLNGRLKRPFD
jgi:hypothetical protein